MSIAEQLKSFHQGNLNELFSDAEQLGEVTQDWDSESTEFDFVDGSVLIVCNGEVFTYGSR